MHAISSFLDNEDSVFHETEQPLYISPQKRLASPNRISISRSIRQRTSDSAAELGDFVIHPQNIDFSVVKDECTYSMQLFIMMKHREDEFRDLLHKGKDDNDAYFGKVHLIMPNDLPEVFIQKVEAKGFDNYVVTLRLNAKYDHRRPSDAGQKSQRSIIAELFDELDNLIYTHTIPITVTILRKHEYEKYKRQEEHHILQESIITNRRSITPLLGRQNKKLDAVVSNDPNDMPLSECDLPFPAQEVQSSHLTTSRKSFQTDSPPTKEINYSMHSNFSVHDVHDEERTYEPEQENRFIYELDQAIVDAWTKSCDRHNRTLSNWGVEDDELTEEFQLEHLLRAKNLILSQIQEKPKESEMEPKPLQINRIIAGMGFNK